jgi:alpha-D-ribose 1-methylphosphonate 5-triphosphate synthase subunit PhnG
MYAQSEYLSIMSRAEAGRLKSMAEQVLDALEDLKVVENRTGLIMTPCRDTAAGDAFHLGEVLASEARVEIDGVTGYGVCLGRDNEQSLAMAVLDAALQLGRCTGAVEAFLQSEHALQQAEDAALRGRIEKTRADMETQL